MRKLPQLCLWAVMAAGLITQESVASVEKYRIEFVEGTFYGPGKMPEVPMANGIMHVVELDKNLNGVTPYFNNGEQEPNITSYIGENGKFGFLSDGTPYNEYMDGGVVDVGYGALSLLNVVTRNGPHHGVQNYSLTKDCSWRITTDLALDPGFKQGILITHNILITSGVAWVPNSLQSLHKIPGGAEQAGSLPAGVALIGRMGDQDRDGFLDGRVVGVSVIPLEHIFYPGAPVAQSREMISNIPVSAMDALALSIVGISSFQPVFARLFEAQPATQGADLGTYTARLLKDVHERLASAEQNLKLKPPTAAAGSQFGPTIESLTAEASSLSAWFAKAPLLQDGRIPTEIRGRIEGLLDEVHRLGQTLRGHMAIECGAS